MADDKDVVFIGSSLSDLRAFPETARRDAGYQIDRVQLGLEPMDWKPMNTLGAGVREIRIHAEGAYRVIYLAKFEDAVYVLHAFEKKSQKTPRKAIDLAKRRYQALVKSRL
jgi:phage-related protein